MEISSDFNNAITNLITMNSTVSGVKETVESLLALDKSSSSSSSSTSTEDYDESMDYNGDGKVSIDEKIKSYTLKVAEQLTSGSTSTSSSSSSSTTSKEDINAYAKSLVDGYESGQTALNQKLIDAAYNFGSKTGVVSYLSFIV